MFDDGDALIASDDVDAVLIASIGETHAAFTLACIAAGQARPVREAARAHDARSASRSSTAEVALGRRLVIVGLHAPPGPRLPAGQGLARRRRDRRRADAPQRPPQPDGARVVHELHDDDRLDHPRDRHQPRGCWARSSSSVQVIPPKRTSERLRPTSRTRSSRCSRPRSGILVDGRVLRQLPVRLRRPVRARRLGGDGVAREPGRRRRRSRPAMDATPVAPELAGPVRRRLRGRAPGLDQRPRAGRDRRPERVGRLRGDPRHRVRRRGGRAPASGWPSTTSRSRTCTGPDAPTRPP